MSNPTNKIKQLNDAIASEKNEIVKSLLNDALKNELKKVDVKMKERKYWIKQKLMLAKAEKSGIKVSEQEIDVEYKKSFPNND
jgi:hypothetical protein